MCGSSLHFRYGALVDSSVGLFYINQTRWSTDRRNPDLVRMYPHIRASIYSVPSVALPVREGARRCALLLGALLLSPMGLIGLN